jgi:hypothetical protein
MVPNYVDTDSRTFLIFLTFYSLKMKTNTILKTRIDVAL